MKRSGMVFPRPTKASLARQSKIRNTLVSSSTSLKPIQNEPSKSESDLTKISIAKRGCIVAKNNFLFKRGKSTKKLAGIVSASSLDNSTADGETLKQVIVASLTENVKRIDLGGKTNSDNKENSTSKLPIAVLRKSQNSTFIENFQIEPIEFHYSNEFSSDVEQSTDDELIDPSYAMDYIVDIMNLLYAMEKKLKIRDSYLSNSTTSMTTMPNGSAARPWKLTGKHRTIVVGWMIQLFYARFHLSQDALHICIGLLDRFLQQSTNDGTSSFVTQKNLQLIAVATFLIAAKLEETHHPPVDELVYVTDHTYTSEQVKRMEKKILHELNFELNRPTSLQFLRRFSFISSAGDEQHAIGKFLIDMALLDVASLSFSPSLIAASATYISRYILSENSSANFDECWPEELRNRSPYKTFDSIKNGIRNLAQCLDKYFLGQSAKEFELLAKRYEHEQLSKASLYCSQKRVLIHQLANDRFHDE